MKFQNVDIFYKICYIFDLSSALACRVVSVNNGNLICFVHHRKKSKKKKKRQSSSSDDSSSDSSEDEEEGEEHWLEVTKGMCWDNINPAKEKTPHSF